MVMVMVMVMVGDYLTRRLKNLKIPWCRGLRHYCIVGDFVLCGQVDGEQ